MGVGKRREGRAGLGGGRRVVKATVGAAVNLPTTKSMRVAVHTCSAGPLKSAKPACRREDSPNQCGTWETLWSIGGVKCQERTPGISACRPHKSRCPVH